MKRNVLALLRTFVFAAFVPALAFSLVACEPENESDNEDVTGNLGSSGTSDYEAVDLGLSVKWASCNVGAESPEEYGGYYAWGETEEKDDYLPSTYLYSKVNIGSDIAETEYDVAHKLLGGGWRMPTEEEYVELCENCVWQWETVNGINGYKVVGLNGNSIFLPAAGYRYGTVVDYLGMRGNHGYYWSSTEISESKVYCLHFNSTKNFGMGENGHNPYDGHTIRPVLGSISENQKYVLRLLTQDQNVSYKATTIDVELKSNVNFEYEILEDSWIRELKPVISTSGIHSIVFEVSENTSRVSREGHIVFYNSEYAVADTLTLVQAGNPNVSLYEAVELGLSVKWASCNVGAESPEEYGDYFAWGETTTKSSYTESNSVTYGLSISELESRGIIDVDGNLTAAYDAATANWGSDWRMPTLDEMKELVDKCTWSWTTQNGVKGYKVTGSNGNSIFLPAAGYRHDTSLINAGSYGLYWSATPYSHSYSAYYLRFYSRYYDWNYYNRGYGFTVRPVSE